MNLPYYFRFEYKPGYIRWPFDNPDGTTTCYYLTREDSSKLILEELINSEKHKNINP